MYLCMLEFVYICKDHCFGYGWGAWDYRILWHRNVNGYVLFCRRKCDLMLLVQWNIIIIIAAQMRTINNTFTKA